MRWRVFIPSGPMAVDDLANRIASFFDGRRELRRAC